MELPSSGGTPRHSFETRLGHLLRFGVTTAALIIVAGGAIYLVRHGRETPDYRVFHGEPSELRSVGGIVHAAARGSGRGVIQLGLLVLVATPAARVLASGVGFAAQRDWLYVLVVSIVFVLLLYSLTVG